MGGQALISHPSVKAVQIPTLVLISIEPPYESIAQGAGLDALLKSTLLLFLPRAESDCDLVECPLEIVFGIC